MELKPVLTAVSGHSGKTDLLNVTYSARSATDLSKASIRILLIPLSATLDTRVSFSEGSTLLCSYQILLRTRSISIRSHSICLPGDTPNLPLFVVVFLGVQFSALLVFVFISCLLGCYLLSFYFYADNTQILSVPPSRHSFFQ